MVHPNYGGLRLPKTPIKLTHVINPEITYITRDPIHPQQQSPLLSLPADVLDIIITFATPNTAEKIALSLTCKNMARRLPHPHKSTGMPRPLVDKAASLQKSLRWRFLDRLQGWIEEDSVHVRADGTVIPPPTPQTHWKLCSVCLMFKPYEFKIVRTYEDDADGEPRLVGQEVVDEWSAVRKAPPPPFLRGSFKANARWDEQGRLVEVRRKERGQQQDQKQQKQEGEGIAGWKSVKQGVVYVCPKHRVNPVKMMEAFTK